MPTAWALHSGRLDVAVAAGLRAAPWASVVARAAALAATKSAAAAPAVAAMAAVGAGEPHHSSSATPGAGEPLVAAIDWDDPDSIPKYDQVSCGRAWMPLLCPR